MDIYVYSLLVLGLLGISAAWLPRALSGSPIPYPLLYLIAGWLLFMLMPSLGSVSPFEHPKLAEHLSELAVILALAGAGFKIDTPFHWRKWGITWRLLGITMPLSILSVAIGGWLWAGLGPAAALLLGAVLAPTDPVLAGDIQVAGPHEGDQNQVRFNLTAEAGLNDSLAFPFVYLALFLLTEGLDPSRWLGHWLLLDVVYRLGIGLLSGLGLGHLLGWLVFKSPGKFKISENREGFFALALTLLTYSLTEMFEGYGFLAVFVAALSLRESERDHGFHKHLHAFTEQIERLLMVTLLLLLGGAIAGGLLNALTPAGALLGLVFVLVLRPLSGLIALAGSGLKPLEAGLVSFLGIRGMGSFYYLAFAMNHSSLREMPLLWAITAFVVLVSIVLHGILAPMLMKRLEAVTKI